VTAPAKLVSITQAFVDQFSRIMVFCEVSDSNGGERILQAIAACHFDEAGPKGRHAIAPTVRLGLQSKIVDRGPKDRHESQLCRPFGPQLFFLITLTAT
jgi:hypothetical protein